MARHSIYRDKQFNRGLQWALVLGAARRVYGITHIGDLIADLVKHRADGRSVGAPAPPAPKAFDCHRQHAQLESELKQMFGDGVLMHLHFAPTPNDNVALIRLS